MEEQYYLLFPFALSLLWAGGRRRVIVILCAAAICSLALAHWGALNNPSPALFLLPSRAWELLVGSLAAIYASERAFPLAASRLSRIMAPTGLLLIMGSVFLFTEQTPFPGGRALIPVLGTVLVLLFSSENEFVGRVLGQRAVVMVGLISYSVYLWHQPIMAFVRNFSGSLVLSRGLIAFSVSLTFLLAYATWRWVERPFRDRSVFNRRKVFWGTVGGSSLLVTFGVFGWFSGGLAGTCFSAAVGGVGIREVQLRGAL